LPSSKLCALSRKGREKLADPSAHDARVRRLRDE
jgi:hypothetical protein